MKRAWFTLVILSLILSAGNYSYSETGTGHLRAGLNLGDSPFAPDVSNDRHTKDEADNNSIRWHPKSSQTKLAGVALVMHGLNCRPDKMEAIIKALNAVGIDCLNVSLRGHGSNFTPIDKIDADAARMAAFKSVTYRLWKTEAYSAYRFARQKSDLHQKPLFLIGFSMGGLLGVDLLASNSNVKFDKMILFAPAIAMHQRNYLIRFFSPFPELVIPSAGDMTYLANEGTPMAAYNALFDMHSHFENHLNPEKINIPTIVFIDAEDELVSDTRLNEMVRDQKLDRWKIHPVKKDDTATGVKMHHLVIDEASVGDRMWQEIVNITIMHLLDRQPVGPLA
jgi:alpha-beta hydrolase superfamily lysophospholipase